MNELNKRLFSAEARPGHQHDRRTFIGSSDLYPCLLYTSPSPRDS